MSNPLIHSRSSVKRWGGKVEDYIEIHKFLDSPKSCMNNNTSRMLTHNTWFIYEVIPKVFGYNMHTNIVAKIPDTVKLADSYLFDYNFNGMVHECPLFDTNIFDINEITESLKN